MYSDSKKNLTYTLDIILTDPVWKSQILTGEPDAIISLKGMSISNVTYALFR